MPGEAHAPRRALFGASRAQAVRSPGTATQDGGLLLDARRRVWHGSGLINLPAGIGA